MSVIKGFTRIASNPQLQVYLKMDSNVTDAESVQTVDYGGLLAARMLELLSMTSLIIRLIYVCHPCNNVIKIKVLTCEHFFFDS